MERKDPTETRGCEERSNVGGGEQEKAGQGAEPPFRGDSRSLASLTGSPTRHRRGDCKPQTAPQREMAETPKRSP